MKSYIEQAIRGLESEKNTQANIVKERAMREIIIPKNQELDKARADALAEIQAKCDEEKQSIIKASEAKKKEFEQTVIETETASVNAKYNKVIDSLKKQLADIKE